MCMFCPLFNVSNLVVITAWFSTWFLPFCVNNCYLSVSCHSLFILQCRPLKRAARKARGFFFNNVCSFDCVVQVSMYQKIFSERERGGGGGGGGCVAG